MGNGTAIQSHQTFQTVCVQCECFGHLRPFNHPSTAFFRWPLAGFEQQAKPTSRPVQTSGGLMALRPVYHND